MVQRIARIWFQEQVEKAVDDRRDGQHWLPVLTQNVEAHIALEVDVWMVDFRLTFHFGRLMRIEWRYIENERVACSLPKAFVGCDYYAEVHQVVLVGKINTHLSGKLHLIELLLHPNLTRLPLLDWGLSFIAVLGLFSPPA